MQVAELMSRLVFTVQQHDSLAHAAAAMAARECGSAVVVDDDRRPLAMLTDRDICMAALHSDRPLSQLRVGAAMSLRLHTCGLHDTIAKAEDLMALYQVRRLPVVDRQGRIAGLLSLDDIARQARREVDLCVPEISAAAVGATLGRICRPQPRESEAG